MKLQWNQRSFVRQWTEIVKKWLCVTAYILPVSCCCCPCYFDDFVSIPVALPVLRWSWNLVKNYSRISAFTWHHPQSHTIPPCPGGTKTKWPKTPKITPFSNFKHIPWLQVYSDGAQIWSADASTDSLSYHTSYAQIGATFIFTLPQHYRPGLRWPVDEISKCWHHFRLGTWLF